MEMFSGCQTAWIRIGELETPLFPRFHVNDLLIYSVSASTATLKRTLVIEPAQTAHVTSIMYPFGFPWDFYQETELRTAIGHRLTFERFDVTFSELTNCSNDSLNVFDLSLSAEPEKAMYTSPCPLNCTTSAIDVPGSFLNVAKITLQSGFHDSRVSSIQFQAVVTSVPGIDIVTRCILLPE